MKFIIIFTDIGAIISCGRSFHLILNCEVCVNMSFVGPS